MVGDEHDVALPVGWRRSGGDLPHPAGGAAATHRDGPGAALGRGDEVALTHIGRGQLLGVDLEQGVCPRVRVAGCGAIREVSRSSGEETRWYEAHPLYPDVTTRWQPGTGQHRAGAVRAHRDDLSAQLVG